MSEETRRLRRLRNIVELKRKTLELQLAKLAQSLDQGAALRDKLLALEHETGPGAELSLRYVVRTVDIIDRGLGILSSQKNVALDALNGEKRRSDRIGEALLEKTSEEQRASEEADIQTAVAERIVRARSSLT